jgi:hypothetical protein
MEVKGTLEARRVQAERTVQLANLTTAQRDAIVPAAAAKAWHTTTVKETYYDPTIPAWVDQSPMDLSVLIGCFVWAPAQDVANGLLAMNGQFIPSGATLYPELAALWPSWVFGANMSLPNWSGAFVRNFGGASGAVGVLQSHEAGDPGVTLNGFLDQVSFDNSLAAGSGFYSETAVGSGNHLPAFKGALFGGTESLEQDVDHVVGFVYGSTPLTPPAGVPSETRPANRASVLCVIAKV